MAASLHALPGAGSPIRSPPPDYRRSRGATVFGGIDIALVCVFLAGIYTNYTVQISAKVPFPSVPAGVAGLLLLWRWRDRVTTKAFAGFIGVLLLYVISILCATDVGFLPRRTNGLIQLTYSLTVGYGLFLAVTQASRRQIANLFLTFSLVILIGCLLEN